MNEKMEKARRKSPTKKIVLEQKHAQFAHQGRQEMARRQARAV